MDDRWETTTATARRWGITEQLVTRLCRAGRVPGAFYFSRRWVIPAGVVKPYDRRSS